MSAIEDKIFALGVVPVIKIDDPQEALPLGEALIAGSLPVAEITFRTAAARQGIKLLREHSPSMLVGAGTITSVAEAEQALEAGAQFIVSPGYSAAVVSFCQAADVPIFPGVNNATQIQEALAQNLSILKFFPAEASGGIKMLDALVGPFPAVKFMPTGGIGTDNLATYMKKPYVAACGGSWMVKSSLIQNEQWSEISRLSRQALFLAHGFSFAHLELANPAAVENQLLQNLLPADLQSTLRWSPEPRRNRIALSCWNLERSLAYIRSLDLPVDELNVTENSQGKPIEIAMEIKNSDFELIVQQG